MPKKILKKRFIDNNDGTISDSETGLMWAKEGSAENLNFQAAKKYCKDFKLAKYKDWRLPTVKELISIVDYEKHNPAINSIFKCESAWYWSGTVYADDSGGAWVVSFHNGYVGWHSKKGGSSYVRPVRQY